MYTYAFPPGPTPGGSRIAGLESKGGLYPFSTARLPAGNDPGNPGMPGNPGIPPGILEGGTDNCGGVVPDALPLVVLLETLSLEMSPEEPSEGTIFFEGTGVDEADDRPLLGLAGSFFE
jgi:hypothetical protein